MEIYYKIDKPDEFTKSEKESFIDLLKKQGKVKYPDIKKLDNSSLLCLVSIDNKLRAIGAIKQVYSAPFDYAGEPQMKEEFAKYELGYLFVDDNLNGLGIGKSISKLLLHKLGNENVFATTEISDENKMKIILKKCEFKEIGKSYKGPKT